MLKAIETISICLDCRFARRDKKASEPAGTWGVLDHMSVQMEVRCAACDVVEPIGARTFHDPESKRFCAYCWEIVAADKARRWRKKLVEEKQSSEKAVKQWRKGVATIRRVYGRT